MSQNGKNQAPVYRAFCKLCPPTPEFPFGKPIAETSILNVPLIGEIAGRQIKEYATVLLNHLQKKHLAEAVRGGNICREIATELPGWLIMNAFAHEDPTVCARIEKTRATIFSLVKKNSIADESLETVAKSLGFDHEDTGRIFDALKAVRDACCEIGQFAPTQVAGKDPITGGAIILKN